MDDATVVKVLRSARPDLVAVYRFGSTVDGTAVAESDVDYALLAGAPLGGIERFELATRIAAETGTEVDLVDLRRAPTVLQMQVLARGQLVAELDSRERQRFETYICSSYARLNEERRGILERIHAEESVYGR
jgi:uncharacterized protein